MYIVYPNRSIVCGVDDIRFVYRGCYYRNHTILRAVCMAPISLYSGWNVFIYRFPMILLKLCINRSRHDGNWKIHLYHLRLSRFL